MTGVKARAVATIAAALTAGFAAPPAVAQPDVRPVTLGQAQYAGSGCPSGSVNAVLGPDGRRLSVFYQQFLAEAGGATGRPIDRKDCRIAIPVHVPSGFSVSILPADYRGFNALPVGARSTLMIEHFFAGARGQVFSRTFTGPLNADFLIPATVLATSTTWSPCGEDVVLLVIINLTLTTVANREAFSRIDAAVSGIDEGDPRSPSQGEVVWPVIQYRSC